MPQRLTAKAEETVSMARTVGGPLVFRPMHLRLSFLARRLPILNHLQDGQQRITPHELGIGEIPVFRSPPGVAVLANDKATAVLVYLHRTHMHLRVRMPAGIVQAPMALLLLLPMDGIHPWHLSMLMEARTRSCMVDKWLLGKLQHLGKARQLDLVRVRV